MSAADVIASTASLAPSQILALLQTKKITLDAPTVSAVGSVVLGDFASQIAANGAKSEKILRTAGAALMATGYLAPMGIVLEAYSYIALPFAQFMESLTGQKHGVQCHSVSWASNFYYSYDAAVNNNNFPKALPLANGKSSLAKGTLAALVIPVLCQVWADFENCLPSGNAAYISNTLIASLVNVWNQGAVGGYVDYFVPFVPSGLYATVGWGGWNNGGVVNYDLPVGPFDRVPPFTVPGQAAYAFLPLSLVPTTVADPSTEWNDSMSSNPAIKPGAQWSRISAKAGPFTAGTTAEKVIVGAGLTSLAAVAAGAYYAWRTGKTFLDVIELAAKALPRP